MWVRVRSAWSSVVYAYWGLSCLSQLITHQCQKTSWLMKAFMPPTQASEAWMLSSPNVKSRFPADDPRCWGVRDEWHPYSFHPSQKLVQWQKTLIQKTIKVTVLLLIKQKERFNYQHQKNIKGINNFNKWCIRVEWIKLPFLRF